MRSQQSDGKAALIVVDMQEDFCEPQGSLAIPGARELASAINELLAQPGFTLRLATQDFHPANHVSFASQHTGKVAGQDSIAMLNPSNSSEVHTIPLWPDHCIQNTPGASIIPEIDRFRIEHIIRKGWDKRLESFSGFGPPFRQPAVAMTELDEILKDHAITHVFVVGVGFDGCVKQTALDAVEFGYETHAVLSGVNAVAGNEGRRKRTLEELETKGVRLIEGIDAEELHFCRKVLTM